MASLFLLLMVCGMLGPCCGVSSPGWFRNISTELFSLPGDIKLGGLFPINQHSSSSVNQAAGLNQLACDSLNRKGLGLALVMKYAVEEINADPGLLPGVRLGYEIYDTCRDSSVIVKPALSFLTAKSSDVLSVECNYTDYETSISAVIGPQTSEMVSVIGKLLGFFLMPQISYGATSDKFSDSQVYPSFFRTVPSDIWQVDAMARLMKRFSWNWVAVVGSEEEYGQRGVQQFSKIAENMSVCVAYQGLIPIYTNPDPAIRTILDNIQATAVRVVVVFALADQVKQFFTEVIKRSLVGVWIASSSWAINDQIYSLPGINAIGTVIGFTDQMQSLSLLTPFTEELLQKLSREPAPQPVQKPGDPQNPCPQCWSLSPSNISLVTDTLVQRSAFAVYAAIYSVAQALHDLLGCSATACEWDSTGKLFPWKLLQVLKNTSVNISGTVVEYDQNGNPNVGYSLIQWIWSSHGLSYTTIGSYYKEKLELNESVIEWHTNNSETPQSTCSAKCETGQVRRVKGFHSCCFDCIDCLEGTYQENEDDIQCTKCPDRQWSHRRSTNCSDPVFEVLGWSTPDALYMLLAGLLLLLCQGSVAVLLLRHRRTPMVSASGGALTFAALLGLAGATLSLTLFLGQPGDQVCRLQLPLISMFQTVALSIILAVSLQIFLVTEFPAAVAPRLQTLRGPCSWALVLTCCLVQSGLCGWFVQEGPTLSEHRDNMTIDFLVSFLACPIASDKLALMQGLNGLMALVSFMATFMAVKPLHQYNLARDITFSTLIYCVIWVIFIPVYTGYSTSDSTDSKNRAVVHVYFTLAAILGLVVAYYAPKCFFLLRRADLNTVAHFSTFLEGTPPTPVEEEPQPAPQEEAK